MIQIIKEISEELLGKSIFLESSDNVTFMAIINPETDPILDLGIKIEEREGKYKVKKMQPVDMFPHTYHVEYIVLLESK